MMTLALGCLLILCILLHNSMNKAKAELTATEPIQQEEISVENVIVEKPVAEEEVKSETEAQIEPAESEQPMELLVIRDELRRKAQETFLRPGWLHIQITHHDLVNPDDSVVVPDNGQILSNSWTLDDWYLITEDRYFAAVYSKKTNVGWNTNLASSVE